MVPPVERQPCEEAIGSAGSTRVHHQLPTSEAKLDGTAIADIKQFFEEGIYRKNQDPLIEDGQFWCG